MIDAKTIKASARGDWVYILNALWVDERITNGKHQPCPFCGGKDRFRFTDYQGDGGFICNQCQPQGGDGFALLMMLTGLPFKAVLSAVASVLGMSDTTSAPRPIIAPKPPTTDQMDNIALVQGVWDKSRAIAENSPVLRYLHHRGLRLPENRLSKAIRHFEGLGYWHDGQLVGQYHAMIAKICNIDGVLMGVHQTYLEHLRGQYIKLDTHPNTGEPIPSKKMRVRYQGCLKGCAVQLYQPIQGVLAVAEGIETALAVHEADGLPVWACLSAWGMANLTLPKGLTNLHIYADNDENDTGIKSAFKLAERAEKTGVNVAIYEPELMGFDALDMLNQAKGGD